ncbi:MAG: glycosyl hydrolase family 28-related protein [Bacteroidota bacterium]
MTYLPIKKFFTAVVFIATYFIAGAQSYSKLWGKEGELWDKKKIPDFTDAGYKSGRVEIPHFKEGINVTDFGAKGDGVTDNTAAFKKAILACKDNTALIIPAGVFLLSDTIRVHKSNIAVRGAGKDKTILYFSKGIEELYPDYNVVNKNQTRWSWSGALFLFDGDISNIGIENLSVRFPDSLYAGHNFHERAYNAIGFANKAHDGWVRNINFTGADIAIWIERSAHHITAEEWIIQSGPNRAAQAISGHHAVNVYGGHNLLQYFEFKVKYVHDLSVESAFSVYNVFHSGKGKDICIDHHNHEQTNNLFTDIDAGIGSRIYVSGGNSTPRGLSFNETYWNIRGEKNMEYCDQFNTNAKHSRNNVQVAVKTARPSIFGDADGNWFETIDPANIFPSDLYLAQLKFHHYAVIFKPWQ